MTSFNNHFGCVCHHKSSKWGKCHDYVIKFNTLQHSIEYIIPETCDLIQQLIHSFKATKILGRLIAKVNFQHFNSQTNDQSSRSYHFTSYQSEEIVDVEDFYVRHMTKIASRLDTFNQNGSNLIIENIECIYIQLSIS